MLLTRTRHLAWAQLIVIQCVTSFSVAITRIVGYNKLVSFVCLGDGTRILHGTVYRQHFLAQRDQGYSR